MIARTGWMIAGCLSLVVIVGACDEDAPRSADDDEGTSGSGASGASQGAGGGSGGGGSLGGAGGVASTTTGSGGSDPVLTCLIACDTAADCDLGAGPAWDADNYACANGGCIYLGCNSDAECQTQGNMVCRESFGIDLCLPACAASADCDLGGGPAFDADNYACVGGGCVYQGCLSDVECQSLGNYVCRDAGAGTSFCLQACGAPADCDLGAGPAWDADNYACTAGACIYTGCTSTSECMSQGDYICGSP